MAALGEPVSAAWPSSSQGHPPVDDGQHLQDFPGARGQHPQVVTDGRRQRRGQRGAPWRSWIEVEPLAEHRTQVQRVPAGVVIKPLDGLVVQRLRLELGRQRGDILHAEPVQ